MAKLISSGTVSLDGFMADPEGNYDWSIPGDDVLAYLTWRERSVGTHLYGRRMYEEMMEWETADQIPGQDQLIIDFARTWQAADKIVYSTTLGSASTARTEIKPTFDLREVQQMKATLDQDIVISGPCLAEHAIRAGLVDEYQLYVSPVAVGGGLRFFPTGTRVHLTLMEHHRFDDGVVFLRYAAAP
ncbi:dihydrofolate reductase [Arthrobacter sp. CAN_A214]|uniref:dihydrofolate reductase family protein n=1 Tax=Arthrobacter sp. CAN_A214 TaxID=2787720 RepID=UPI0018CAE526